MPEANGVASPQPTPHISSSSDDEGLVCTHPASASKAESTPNITALIATFCGGGEDGSMKPLLCTALASGGSPLDQCSVEDNSAQAYNHCALFH